MGRYSGRVVGHSFCSCSRNVVYAAEKYNAITIQSSARPRPPFVINVY